MLAYDGISHSYKDRVMSSKVHGLCLVGRCFNKAVGSKFFSNTGTFVDVCEDHAPLIFNTKRRVPKNSGGS